MKTKFDLKKIGQLLSTTSFMFLLVMPASTNYKLKDYGFGSGGTANSSGGGYSLEAISGEQSGQKENSTSYGIGGGLIFTGQANVPVAPTFTNPSNYYNRLQVVINTSGNPTDTKYVIAISTDNFVTITNYIQSADGTIGATQDYQTYATWGGASGIPVVGLQAGTTYYVKAKAMQGNFTETGYGPTASAATVNPTLSFGITTDLQSSPPFEVSFGDMIPATVNSSSPHQVNVTLDTNAANGGNVYVAGANGGLHSTIASYTINSVTTANLGVLSEGFGAQGLVGGTLTLVAPYDTTSGDAVGIVDPTVRTIFSAAGPITGGTGSFLLKAKPASTAPAASDYSETLTVVASGSF